MADTNEGKEGMSMTATKIHYLFVAFSWKPGEGWHFKAEYETNINMTEEDVLDVAAGLFEEIYDDAASHGYCVFNAETMELICVVEG